MKKIIQVLILTLYIGVVNAEQLCRTDQEIPSSTPTSQFVSEAEGIVVDTKTGLMWAKCPLGLSGENCTYGSGVSVNSWTKALTIVKTSTLGGFKDWRLPNIKELRSIVEERCVLPAINLAIFPNTSSTGLFWSSTPVSNTNNALHVSFAYGNIVNYDYNSNDYVRLVRDQNSP